MAGMEGCPASRGDANSYSSPSHHGFAELKADVLGKMWHACVTVLQYSCLKLSTALHLKSRSCCCRIKAPWHDIESSYSPFCGVLCGYHRIVLLLCCQDDWLLTNNVWFFASQHGLLPLLLISTQPALLSFHLIHSGINTDVGPGRK